MQNKENTIYYNNYLTEVKAQIRSRINEAKESNRDILFVADTSAGKTTVAIELAKELVSEGKETGIVVPLQSIVKSKEGNDSLMDYGSGKYFEMANELSNNAYFTVYNTFSNSSKTNTTEFLFVDEPQVLIQQSNIRGVVNANILDSDATKIYLTGTPFLIPQAFDCDIIYMERNAPSTLKRIVKSYRSSDNDESIILKIADHNKGKCTKVIRVNNKDVITKMASNLKHSGYSVVTYYSFSDSEDAYRLENEEYLQENTFDDLRKGIFNNVDFVLCTSALDSGVDLVCDRELFLYCIGRVDHDRDIRLMPHPVDVKQFSARPRKQEVVKVYCIGQFENGNTTSTHYEGQEDFLRMLKSNSIDTLQYLHALSLQYQVLEYNNPLTWTENLESLGMIVHHRGFLETIDGIKIALRYDLQILKHLHKSKQYNDIVHYDSLMISAPNNETAHHEYKLGIDLEAIADTEDDFIYKNSDFVQIEALATQIKAASMLGIDLAPYLSERAFSTNKLKSVIRCVESIRRDSLLGSAIRKIIKEGSISKKDLRLLEGEGEKLETFLKTYFKVNRKSFTQEDIQNIIVGGLKTSKNIPPIALIQYLSDTESDWLNPLVKSINKHEVEYDNKYVNDSKEIQLTNSALEDAIHQFSLAI